MNIINEKQKKIIGLIIILILLGMAVYLYFYPVEYSVAEAILKGAYSWGKIIQ